MQIASEKLKANTLLHLHVSEKRGEVGSRVDTSQLTTTLFSSSLSAPISTTVLFEKILVSAGWDWDWDRNTCLSSTDQKSSSLADSLPKKHRVALLDKDQGDVKIGKSTKKRIPIPTKLRDRV
jgi:hypothetical protein